MAAKKKVTKKAVKTAKVAKKKPGAPKRAPAKPARAPAVAMPPRADYGQAAETYFAAVDPALREITDRLRRIVKEAAPKATESLKWGMPVYEHKGLLCYIKAAKGYAKLGFYEQGVYLSDPDGLLEGTGDAMRHVKLRSAQEIRAGLFAAWIKRAIEINEDK
ncbi:MAG: DUF1801 domain-containing protein [Phycisphaerales bacterium]